MDGQGVGGRAYARERIKKSARLRGGEHRERIARRYQVVKYFAGNGGNWGLNGCGGRLNGFRRSGSGKKTAKSMAPHVKPPCGSPKFVSGFIVRATRPKFLPNMKKAAPSCPEPKCS